MSAWFFDFLSNLAAGIVGGAVLAAAHAASVKRRARRLGTGDAAPMQSEVAPPQVRVVVARRTVEFEERRTVGRPAPVRRIREVSPEDDQQLVLLVIGSLLAAVLVTYAYLRYQDFLLFGAASISAFVISAVFVSLLLVSLRAVDVVGILVVHGAVALVAAAVFVINLYLLLRAAQEPGRRHLADDARQGLGEFTSRHSLPEMLAVVYQLAGFALSLLMCLWAGSGLLARVQQALALSQDRIPGRLVAWLARTGPQGFGYVVGVVLLSTASLLFTSGWLYGFVDRHTATSSSVVATELSTSTKQMDGAVRFCGRLSAGGSPLPKQLLQLQTKDHDDWKPLHKPVATNASGQSCARVPTTGPAHSVRWVFGGDSAHGSSVSEARSI
jgi:hypothetical protein